MQRAVSPRVKPEVTKRKFEREKHENNPEVVYELHPRKHENKKEKTQA
jgi:hypothetical protein